MLKSFNTSAINDPTINSYLLGHKVRFIFYFASDSSYNSYYGIAIDDVKIQVGIPKYHIYGYVTDSDGNPVEGATVWVNDTDLGLSFQTTTDSNGYYEIYTYNGNDGDNIHVDAVKPGLRGDNEDTLAQEKEIDVSMESTQIPELSFLAVAILAVFSIALLRKKF